MDSTIQAWILDFMNLIFGASEEKEDFWKEVVLTETSTYYSYPLDNLKRHEIRLNALYFALIDLIGLKVTQIDPLNASKYAMTN